MKVKSEIYRILISTVVVIVLVNCHGCSKTEGPGKEVTLTPQLSPTAVEASKDEQNTDIEATPTQHEQEQTAEQVSPIVEPTVALQPEGTPTAVPTPIPDESDDEEDDYQDTSAPEPDTDDGSDDEPEDEIIPTETITPEPKSDAAGRDELWKETFLIRIPRFEGGRLTESGAVDTFDYAYFSDTTEEEVNQYIEALREKGFVQSVKTEAGAAGIIYEAHNEENWWALVNYAEGQLSLGSGFYEVEKSAPDIITELWTVSALSVMPVFEAGEYAGSDMSAGMTGAYVIFENVDAEYVRGYIAQLEAAGFALDADSGDSDGFIWYNALNPEEAVCDLTFFDGVVRLEATQ